jgi:hypothetical protein
MLGVGRKIILKLTLKLQDGREYTGCVRNTIKTRERLL